MPFTRQGLLQINTQLGFDGFRGNYNTAILDGKLQVINAIPDAFERCAYLAMILIRDQPFNEGNHRTSAAAVSVELGNLTNRTRGEITTWLRTAHQRPPFSGMDLQMLQESDSNPVVTQARRAFIQYLGG